MSHSHAFQQSINLSTKNPRFTTFFFCHLFLYMLSLVKVVGLKIASTCTNPLRFVIPFALVISAAPRRQRAKGITIMRGLNPDFINAFPFALRALHRTLAATVLRVRSKPRSDAAAFSQSLSRHFRTRCWRVFQVIQSNQ